MTLGILHVERTLYYFNIKSPHCPEDGFNAISFELTTFDIILMIIHSGIPFSRDEWENDIQRW